MPAKTFKTLRGNITSRSLETPHEAEIDGDPRYTRNSETSRPFDKPRSGRGAVKVINHLGDEVMKC